jgi:uncharacterized membrane protein YhaH (DUF805 family)
MTWKNYLFSFSGRINRAKYWQIIIIYVLVVAVPLALLMFVDVLLKSTPIGLIITKITGIFFFLLVAFMLYVSIAIFFKRLHDRNKGGWWIVPFAILPGILNGIAQASSYSPTIPHWLVSVCEIVGPILSVWAFIEIGCLRGTVGPNRFGPDPLERLT